MNLRFLSPIAITCLVAAVAMGAEGDAKPLPPGIKGFDGTLGGKVVSVEPDGTALVMKVADVPHVNARSTAKAPKAVVGREVTITPIMAKGKDGKMYPQERHATFVKSLKPGQDVQIDCASNDGNTLQIMLLTKDQRKGAQKSLDREEKQQNKQQND